MVSTYEEFEKSFIACFTYIGDGVDLSKTTLHGVLEFSGILLKLKEKYDYIINRLDTEAIYCFERGGNPQKDLGLFHDTGGHQLIAEGAVSDMNKPYDPNSWNFHLQNTSRWTWAFGLVYDKDNGEFSIHT